MPKFDNYELPTEGQAITIDNGVLQVPNNPIIPFIEGDGTGPDIWAASKRVLDAAVEKAYNGEKKIAWYEVFAGEKAFNKFNSWLPNDTLTAIRE
ncbi:Isocitrate dehydrogenase [NADP] [compost metagenome]